MSHESYEWVPIIIFACLALWFWRWSVKVFNAESLDKSVGARTVTAAVLFLFIGLYAPLVALMISLVISSVVPVIPGKYEVEKQELSFLGLLPEVGSNPQVCLIDSADSGLGYAEISEQAVLPYQSYQTPVWHEKPKVYKIIEQKRRDCIRQTTLFKQEYAPGWEWAYAFGPPMDKTVQVEFFVPKGAVRYVKD